MNNWISIKERLPEFQKEVLVTDGKEIAIAYRWELSNENGFCWSVAGCGGWDFDLPFPEFEITHWMDLPELPK